MKEGIQSCYSKPPQAGRERGLFLSSFTEINGSRRPVLPGRLLLQYNLLSEKTQKSYLRTVGK